MANDINGILAAANEVLMKPSTTLSEACCKCGVKFLTSLLPVAISIAILRAVDKYKKNKRENEEKERMKNEIIRKQQAIINKLRKENELNSQEIINLKDTLSMLEEVINQINRA